MNKELNIIQISKGGQFATTSYPFEQNKKAELLNCSSAFYVHRESITILPKLIISSLKQRLTIQPTDYNESACDDLTVLSCDLHIIEVVRGLGIPFVG